MTLRRRIALWLMPAPTEKFTSYRDDENTIVKLLQKQLDAAGVEIENLSAALEIARIGAQDAVDALRPFAVFAASPRFRETYGAVDDVPVLEGVKAWHFRASADVVREHDAGGYETPYVRPRPRSRPTLAVDNSNAE